MGVTVGAGVGVTVGVEVGDGEGSVVGVAVGDGDAAGFMGGGAVAAGTMTAAVDGAVTGEEEVADGVGWESALQPATTNTVNAKTEPARRIFKRTS